jgi:hypothetical protein
MRPVSVVLQDVIPVLQDMISVSVVLQDMILCYRTIPLSVVLQDIIWPTYLCLLCCRT